MIPDLIFTDKVSCCLVKTLLEGTTFMLRLCLLFFVSSVTFRTQRLRPELPRPSSTTSQNEKKSPACSSVPVSSRPQSEGNRESNQNFQRYGVLPTDSV